MPISQTPWWAWAILVGLVFVGWQRWEAMSCPAFTMAACDPAGILSQEQRDRCVIPPRP